MTEYEIEAFLKTAECGSISAAAEALYISQPALSRRLRALEAELGCVLLARNPGQRQTELTVQGQRFLPMARKWQQLYRDSCALGEDEGLQRQTFRLTAIESVSLYVLPAALQGFLAENPVSLELEHGHDKEAYESMETGTPDLAFVSTRRYIRNAALLPAFSERYVWVGASAVSEEKVRVSALQPRDEILLGWSDEFVRWHLREFGENESPAVRSNQASILPELLTGERWAVVPWSAGELLRRMGFCVRPLDSAPEDRVIYCLIPENKSDELTRAFLAHLKTALRGMDGLTDFLPDGGKKL